MSNHRMATRSFRHFVKQEMGAFPHFVIYAILEWALIALLFVDGIIAFVSNKFAEFFELKVPCLLCTRINHILVCKKSSHCYCNNSICESHKKDISSLAYCHIHRKLSDIKTTCEGCLLSFATGRESDTDRYKSNVGVSHEGIANLMEDELRAKLRTTGRKEAVVMGSEQSLIQRCSCCGEPLRHSSKDLRRSSSSVVAQEPTPSPRMPVMMRKNDGPRSLELPHI